MITIHESLAVSVRRWIVRSKALLATALLFPAGIAAQGVGLEIGTIVPASGIEVQDLDGNSLDLMSLVRPGKPTLFEFWATWCEQCEALQPQMDQIQAEHGDDLTIVAVAVAVSQTPRRITRHLEDHDPGYRYVYDHRGNGVRSFNAATTSIVVIVNADRRVIYSNVGPDQDLLAAALAAVGTMELDPVRR